MFRVPVKEWYENRYYRSYEYQEYLNQGYRAGDVIVVKETDHICIVLGYIDNIHQELRTDAIGMISFSEIRHATKEDIEREKDFDYVKKDLPFIYKEG